MVVLEVVNPANQSLSVRLKLELLDPDDDTRGLAVRDLTLQPGVNQLSIPLTLIGHRLNEEDDQALPWYRLRYRIDPTLEAKSAPGAAGGVISLSEIDTPDIFSLEVSAPRHTHRSVHHYTHVRAFHPITAKPVKDVNVSVELKLDDDEPGAAVLRHGGSARASHTLHHPTVLGAPARLHQLAGEESTVG